jgi:6-phosphofructokinase 1
MAGCRRIAILTSGGDAPGMNAAIRAATLVGRSLGAEVFGVERGYRGLLEDAIAPLQPADVAAILREGGTILGSARCKEFAEREVRDRARANLARHGIDGVIVIGGNGSLTGALRLADPAELGGGAATGTAEGPPLRVIGVPASIDNDLGLTGLAIGVDTAMNTIVEACDKIADTATAHDRTFIVEVMGRDCGYLAMTSAIAVGADLALFPEAGKPEAAIVEQIVETVLTARARARAGGGDRGRRTRRVIVIKAEGVSIPIERLKAEVDARLRERAPGADPAGIETRVTVLGHVVRGGRPSAFDRLLGSRLANVAVRALIAGESHKMAAWLPPTELPAEVAARSPADPYCWLVDLAAALAETEHLLAGRSPLSRWRAGAFEDIEDALLL